MFSLAQVSAAGIRRFLRDNSAHDIFAKRGYHLLRKHYYSLPIPDDGDLQTGHWDHVSELVGIDMNEAEALELLRERLPPYLEEFRERFGLNPTDNPEEFYLLNTSFMAVDSHLYYALIREHRPRRIVEIGAGNSTLVALEACRRNQQQYGDHVEVIAIEPHPSKLVNKLPAKGLQLIRDRVQNVDIGLFTSLEPNDIVFIDSTHALREGGDVWWEFCEILPRLRPGVLVHVHDISLPKPYPRVNFDRHHFYWNEQYLLQAFLTFNSRYRVLWGGNFMLLKHPAEMKSTFPEIEAMRKVFPFSEPTSLWMQVVGE